MIQVAVSAVFRVCIAPPSVRKFTAAAGPVLRDYQTECIETSLKAIAAGKRRQAVSLPVGSGKTVIFANLIPRVPAPTPTATRTLVLAHRVELLQQAAAQIRRGNPALRVSLLDSGESIEDIDVLVGSVPALGRAQSARLQALDPALFKLIVIDEAHHATSPTYLRILKHFGAHTRDTRVCVWGCSATLRRHDGSALSVAFDFVTYKQTLERMWSEGYLCPAQAVAVRTAVDVSRVPTARGDGPGAGDFMLSKLAETLNTPERTAAIVDAWKRWAEGRRSTLVFGADVAHATALTEGFGRVVEARMVDGTTSPENRRFFWLVD